MSRMNSSLGIVLLAGLASAVAGCQGGPLVIRSNRTAYNLAIQETSNEQLILNIVRLRYREPTSFVEISSINTSFGFTLTGNAQLQVPVHGGDVRQFYTTAVMSETPTFSYSPIQGELFAKRIVGEIDLETLALLLRGGWHVDMCLRMLVDQVCELRNDPRTAPPPGEKKSSYDKFCDLCHLWRTMQDRGDFAVSVKEEDVAVPYSSPRGGATNGSAAGRGSSGQQDNSAGGTEIRTNSIVCLELRYKDANEAKAGCDLLGAPAPDKDLVQSFRLEKVIGLTPNAKAATIGIHLRSFVNVLFYLAQGVEVPQRDADRHVVKQFTDPLTGKNVNTLKATSDLFNVRYSIIRPPDCLSAVFYRGAWFYIDDTDIQSKDSFAFLGYVFALQSGEPKQNAPVISLPVGGGGGGRPG